MPKSVLFIICFLFTVAVNAQQRRVLRGPGPGRPLLKELQLTPGQRVQIQELIRQQRLQQLFYDQRLQQILTPAQRQRLIRYNRQKEITDSLNNQKKLP